MKRKKTFILFTIILTTVLLIGCGGESPSQPSLVSETKSPKKAAWTLCLYICGSTLESKQGWASKTINELMEADISENVNVVIQTGGSSSWENDAINPEENNRYEIHDGKLSLVESEPASSMGDANTLSSFLGFCEKNYPAENTAVILWNHGGGTMGGVCYDEKYDNDSLNLSEVHEAFTSGVKSRNGKKYDITGFDACMMGTIEMATMLSDCSRYMVSSEEMEPGAGWDYKGVLADMKNQISAKDMAVAFCENFKEKSESRGNGNVIELAAIDLEKIKAVTDTFDKCLEDLEKKGSLSSDMMQTLTRYTRSTMTFGGMSKFEGNSNLIDLQNLAQKFNWTKIGGKNWKKLIDLIEDAVVYHVEGSSELDAYGLSIWYPRFATYEELADYASTTPLTNYSEFLDNIFLSHSNPIWNEVKAPDKSKGLISVALEDYERESFFDMQTTNHNTDDLYTRIDYVEGSRKFTFDPAGDHALTLNGMILDSETLYHDKNLCLYTCPVTINGNKYFIRIVDFLEDKDLYLLGIITENEHNTSQVERMEIEDINPGDEVCARSIVTGNIRETVTIKDDVVLGLVNIPYGNYDFHFAARDFFGKEYPSEAVKYNLSKHKVEFGH